MTKKWCFLDLETTGVDPEKNGILQISGRLWNSTRGVQETFTLRVRPFPTDVVEKEALLLNGLNLEEGVSPQEAHVALLQVFAKHVDKYNKRDKFFFVGYNAKFDYDFLRKFFARCGDKYFGSWFWFPYIDVMQMAAVKLLDKRFAMENFKLATVARALGVDFDVEQAHGAEYDVQKTEELFQKLIIKDDGFDRMVVADRPSVVAAGPVG